MRRQSLSDPWQRLPERNPFFERDARSVNKSALYFTGKTKRFTVKNCILHVRKFILPGKQFILHVK
jgi:hypothetical protein